MDKKSILGLLIVGAILFGYTFYSAKQREKMYKLQQEQRREQYVKDSIDRALYPEKYAPEIKSIEDSLAMLVNQETRREAAEQLREAQENARVASLGLSLVQAANAEEVLYTLENDVMKVTLSSKGAQIRNVELKNYERYGGGPLMLYYDGSAEFDMEFFIQRYNEAQINCIDYNFRTDHEPGAVIYAGDSSNSLVMRLPVDEETGAFVEYVYTMHPGEYMVDYKVNFVGMKELTWSNRDLRFDWKAKTLQNEKSFKNENMVTTVAYRYPETKKVEQLGASEGTKSGKVSTNLNWLSFKQQFFSSVFIAEKNFSYADFSYNTYKPGTGLMKDFSASLSVPYDPAVSQYNFQFYFGPNKYSTLKAYDLRLEKVIPLGGKLIGWINTGFVIKVFDWLSKYIASFGIIILILTIMIKLIISPLTYKSYMSTAKMRALKPEIDEINERYPKQEDAMKKQQATMELYKRAGVSPMGGCIPMLIQMPILIAMFRFFPASIELRGQRFLWAEDLSAYDSILDLPFKIPLYGDHVSLFTLLMAVAMFSYSRITYKQTAAAGPQMAGMKFMTLYLMPVMMLCIFNSYASGLTYYYMLSQLFTIAQMTGFRYFINEDKLRAKLQSNAAKASAKTKKKSRWQGRYEEALKQQQEAMRKQQGQGTRVNNPKPQATKNQPKKKRK